MLKTSTKNVAQDVVACLVETSGKGLLTEILKWMQMSQLQYNSSADEKIATDSSTPHISGEAAQLTGVASYTEDGSTKKESYRIMKKKAAEKSLKAQIERRSATSLQREDEDTRKCTLKTLKSNEDEGAEGESGTDLRREPRL